MRKEEIIFDTNFLYNKKASSFFGNREELRKFSQVANIVIPEIVLLELKHKYSRSFDEEKKKFFKTILDTFLTHNISDINIEEAVNNLQRSEEILYTTIRLTDYAVLEKMKDLAIKKKPPFEPGDNTDKGFKDTYIYFTTLEYLKETPAKHIFLCSKDSLLKKACERNGQITVINNFEEFTQHSISSFTDDYFVEKLNSLFSLDIAKDDIREFWINIDGNYILSIDKDDEILLIEVDYNSKEILSFSNNLFGPDIYEYITSKEIEEKIINLTESGSFAMTHTSVANLEQYKNFLSDKQIVNILESISENSQIIPDEDVQQFISDIFEPKKDILENKLIKEVKEFISYN